MEAFSILIERIGVVRDEVGKPVGTILVELLRVALELVDEYLLVADALLSSPCVLLGILGDCIRSAEKLPDAVDRDSPLPAFEFVSFLIAQPVDKTEALDMSKIRVVRIS